MDPEQIYQEVLQEEQQKGSAAPVAEGRAKAARQRAAAGSPHPTEPKWWPGAQPHLEDDGAGEAAAPSEEVEEEEAVAEAPEPEPEPAPAAETAPEPEPEPAPAAAPAAAAPTEAAAVQAPAETGGAAPLPDQAPAGAPPPAAAQPDTQVHAPAATAEPQAPPRPAGATAGTAAGNRLRPEDSVTTTAQFDGQKAMYERRKLIDELVATGVPAVTAEDTSRPGAPLLAALYILIPLLAIFILIEREPGSTATAGGDHGSEAPAEPGAGEGEGEGEGAPAGGAIQVVSDNIAFDTDTIEVTAGEEVQIHLVNADSVEHNIAVYESAADGPSQTNPIFQGEIIDGGEEITYTFTAPEEPGDYYFQCDVHPNMNGTFVVQ